MYTLHRHIRVDEQGIAWIDATSYKVSHLVEEFLAHGWSPEEIVYQHHGDVSLAQVHAALSFYYDNREKFDAAFERGQEEFKRLHESQFDSPLRRKLRAQGKLQ